MMLMHLQLFGSPQTGRTEAQTVFNALKCTWAFDSNLCALITFFGWAPSTKAARLQNMRGYKQGIGKRWWRNHVLPGVLGFKCNMMMMILVMTVQAGGRSCMQIAWAVGCTFARLSWFKTQPNGLIVFKHQKNKTPLPGNLKPKS